MPVGSKLTLGLLRDGKQVNVNLELQQSSQNQGNLLHDGFLLSFLRSVKIITISPQTGKLK